MTTFAPTSVLNLLAQPRSLRHYPQIFLLSHMRANTSLFGHIMGSHPQIEGYYEMHIGYYSWKSRFRQKMLLFSEHKPKPAGRYIFDKVLHSEHHIDAAFLSAKDAKVFFSLRSPLQTIPSIVRLYEGIEPQHEFCNPDFAARYYCSRVADLVKTASNSGSRYCYLDAQCLRENTGETLASISDWLELSTNLVPSYKVQTKTGEAKAGDHSSNLLQGKIVSSISDYADIVLDVELLTKANIAYESARKQLVDNAELSITL